MIIIKMYGGLGNQLFKYAAAKSISLDFSQQLQIDKTYFQMDKFPCKHYGFYYPFKLSKYNIPLSYCSKYISKLIEIIRKKRIYKLSNVANILGLNKIFPYYQYQPVTNDFPINRRVIKNSKLTILDGSWVSFKFFRHNYHLFKNEFTLKNELNPLNKNILKKIKNSESVSIHFRLNDYIEKFSSIYSVLPINYYKRSIDFILKRKMTANFFIFSDNIEWVRKNINFKDNNIIYIDNDGPDHEHLFLMSRCRHNIISNSTFSWWGAWMNDNPDKIVISPARWTNPEYFPLEERIPDSWISLK